jgi:hypothetical protein
MPLSPPISPRTLKHTRAIKVEAFARDDGLWDFDAHITDIKTRDFKLTTGNRPAGVPVHDLWLRITVDTSLMIVDAESVSDGVPFPGFCHTINPAYQQLIGLSLLRGFRKALQQRLSGIDGCTHLTELAQVLPTAAIQAFAGEISMPGDGSVNKDAQDNDSANRQTTKPFQIDRCHAMRSDGAAVAQYYPRWAVKSPTGSQTG